MREKEGGGLREENLALTAAMPSTGLFDPKCTGRKVGGKRREKKYLATAAAMPSTGVLGSKGTGYYRKEIGRNLATTAAMPSTGVLGVRSHGGTSLSSGFRQLHTQHLKMSLTSSDKYVFNIHLKLSVV